MGLEVKVVGVVVVVILEGVVGEIMFGVGLGVVDGWEVLIGAVNDPSMTV